MQIPPIVAKIFTLENVSMSTLRLLIFIGAGFFVVMVSQKCNPTVKIDNRELKAIAKAQDSLLKVIAKQDLILNTLAQQRDSQRIVDRQLLNRQTEVSNSIKNLRNEYNSIKTFTLDRANIYRFYIDSLKEYKPY